MKNFCIVSFCNMYVSPYAKTYIDTILNSGNNVTLLFWDRDAVNGDNDNYPNCNKVVYQKKLTNTSGKTEKLLGYLEATRFFRKHIKSHNYAGIIMLQTHVAIACAHVLRKLYKKKYVVDIRDYTLENYLVYRLFERRVINDSYATVISSPAYAKFLPSYDYVLAHNFTSYDAKLVNEIQRQSSADTKPIKISFIGKVRFIDMDRKLLSLFANDERFRLCYFGTGSEVLEEYCRREKIKNVEFYGSFQPNMTVDFYKKTNIINNLYGNHNPFLDYALSNKLYYAAQFHLPILVCPDTYMQEVSEKYNIGFVMDIDTIDAPDKLYNWFVNLDRNKLSDGADSFIDTVKEDTDKYLKMIVSFVNLGGE